MAELEAADCLRELRPSSDPPARVPASSCPGAALPSREAPSASYPHGPEVLPCQAGSQDSQEAQGHLDQELAFCTYPCEVLASDPVSDPASDPAFGQVLDPASVPAYCQACPGAVDISEDRLAAGPRVCSLVLAWRRVETATAGETVEYLSHVSMETEESWAPWDCHEKSSEETSRTAGWDLYCRASPSAPAAGDCSLPPGLEWAGQDCWASWLGRGRSRDWAEGRKLPGTVW